MHAMPTITLHFSGMMRSRHVPSLADNRAWSLACSPARTLHFFSNVVLVLQLIARFQLFTVSWHRASGRLTSLLATIVLLISTGAAMAMRRCDAAQE